MPFKERYPYIKIDYSRGSFGTRSISLLVAFQQGRVIADVLTGFGGSFGQFKDAGALTNISDIPNVANVPAQWSIAGVADFDGDGKVDRWDRDGKWSGDAFSSWRAGASDPEAAAFLRRGTSPLKSLLPEKS